ncbi:MAG: DUF503 domain-containing protein [Candidatus Krumholzibacteria bacterium]|nr:DUF503 domain-containing protein [Candidatus Krumholzibacteria bacterium]
MVIKLLTIDLHLPGRSSLKEKRFVISSLKMKLSKRCNVAVAEIGYQDKWQRSLLAIVMVGNSGEIVEATSVSVLKLLEKDHRLAIIDCTQELR